MPAKQSAKIAGRYRLETIVGTGSSAEVWSAWDTVLDRRVAIKLLGRRSDEEKGRIWREARLAALLGETTAVPIYDFGDDGTHCFIVMELVSDPSLRDVLEATPQRSQKMILGVSYHLLDALAQTHELNIVHRDIKPENLFVVGSLEDVRQVRLVDFGLAFVEECTGKGLGRLTEGPGISGTPAYLSPEQAKGDPIDTASDVYSAGCVLYELACGSPPFHGSLGEVLSKHMYVPAIPLRERDVSLPDAFMDLVEAMLVKTPEDRITATEALTRLSELDQSSLNRQRDRNLQMSREERMVEAAASTNRSTKGSDVGPVQRPLRALASGSPPRWLLDMLGRAEVVVVQQGEEANVQFVGNHEALSPDSALPQVVWLDETTTPALTKLIEKGADFAVSPHMPPSKLRRTLLRLDKAARTLSEPTT